MIVDMFTGSGGTVVTDPDGNKLHTQGNGFNVLTNFDSYDENAITPSNAHLYQDVYACINILSDDIAKLPLKTYVKDKTGEIKKGDEAIGHLLKNRPNLKMSPFDFKKLLMVRVLTQGNFYARIMMDNFANIQSLEPLPVSTRPAVDDNGTLWYVAPIGDKLEVYDNDEVIHIKGYSLDGITGLTPIEVISSAAEANQYANEHNKATVKSGGLPKGVMKIAGTLKKENKELIREEWKRVNEGEDVAITDSGIEYQPISMTQRDMEFIESQKYNKQNISAIYKVPLHKINSLEHATFSNIEHQSIDYVKNTLQPWVVKIEEELNYKLFLEKQKTEGHYVKFNLDSELRGDAESRVKVQEIQLRNALKTINEARSDNENSPLESEFADQGLITLNYTTLENLLNYQQPRLKKAIKDSGGDMNEPTDTANTNDTSKDSKEVVGDEG